MNNRAYLLLLAMALLAGCATLPSAPARHEPAVPPTDIEGVVDADADSGLQRLQGDFAAIPPSDGIGKDDLGVVVRWGGGIDRFEYREDGRSCFLMRAAELKPPYGLPDWGKGAISRFVACRAGRYDGLLFQPFREVTFVGRIAGYVDWEHERLPLIEAEVVYLWSDCLDIDAGRSPECVYGVIEPASAGTR